MNTNIDFDGIAKAVKDVLKEKGLSESELAESCGVSQPALNKMVRGVATPSLATLKKLWPVIGDRLIAEK